MIQEQILEAIDALAVRDCAHHEWREAVKMELVCLFTLVMVPELQKSLLDN